jgi:signal transduction histidine kinase
VAEGTSFPKLVALGSHDIRTPLATIVGFAKTLERSVELEPPADRYVQMMAEASDEVKELLDELSVATRIEDGRYEPVRRETDTRALADAAQERLGADRVRVSGDGASVTTDVEAVRRAVYSLIRATLRHGGLQEVDVVVRGSEIEVTPVKGGAAPVVLGRDLRDFGAAVAGLAISTLGGAVTVDGETLRIRLA